MHLRQISPIEMNRQLQPIVHQPYVKEGYKKISEETKGQK